MVQRSHTCTGIQVPWKAVTGSAREEEGLALHLKFLYAYKVHAVYPLVSPQTSLQLIKDENNVRRTTNEKRYFCYQHHD